MGITLRLMVDTIHLSYQFNYCFIIYQLCLNYNNPTISWEVVSYSLSLSIRHKSGEPNSAFICIISMHTKSIPTLSHRLIVICIKSRVCHGELKPLLSKVMASSSLASQDASIRPVNVVPPPHPNVHRLWIPSVSRNIAPVYCRVHWKCPPWIWWWSDRWVMRSGQKPLEVDRCAAATIVCVLS